MMREAAMCCDRNVRCSNCEAACCRLEVLLITDTGVPDRFIVTDQWGGSSMARLDDGWCAALDRSSNRCRIYEQRPWICREFQMGGPECIAERAANALIRAEALFPRSKG